MITMKEWMELVDYKITEGSDYGWQCYGAESKSVLANQAWDDVDYIDLDVDDDFIQKALAIKAGEDYDTRVSVPVDFTDEELLTYMKMAHEQDMTFNQFIEEALRQAIAKHGPELNAWPFDHEE